MEKIENESRKNLLIKVIDTGIGISSDFFDKIFTLFGKLKQNDPHINKNGIGLGLVISNNLAQMMSRDGKGISLKSEVDFGSEFSFTVPIEEELINFDSSLDEDKKLINVSSYNMNTFLKSSFLKNKWEKNDKNTNDLRILIVDDDSMNCLIHSKYLESFNIYYDIASNGSEAIEFIISKKINHIYYSLIIMDCNMPIMNGFEAAENIKGMINDKYIPHVSIIAVTANASIQEIEHCKKAGMEFFIPKPVSKAALKEKIEETLKIKLG